MWAASPQRVTRIASEDQSRLNRQTRQQPGRLGTGPREGWKRAVLDLVRNAVGSGGRCTPGLSTRVSEM